MTVPNGEVRCRFCGSVDGAVVADLGMQPACDYFPLADAAEPDPVYPLRLWVCTACRLAQLAEDPTEPDEPRGVEPVALVRQAEQAVAAVHAAGLLPDGGVALEHSSPHGGSWLGLLEARGIRAAAGGQADVVVDSFGLMHDADQAAALRLRAAELKSAGLLLVQFHSLAAVLRGKQWNTIRHGHPVYLSTPAVAGMLASVGLRAVAAWWFDLYGGTVLLAARRQGPVSPSVQHLIDDELAAGVGDLDVLRGLAASAAESALVLRSWLASERAQGRTVIGYGAASRAVPLLNHAGIGPDLLPAVADASEAKQGRRFPGAGVPIIAPDELVALAPDDVVLFVPDMLAEVRARLPEVERRGGRWVLLEPSPRVIEPDPRTMTNG